MRCDDHADERALDLANRRALNHFAWLLGIGLAFSLLLPPGLFAPAISCFAAIAAGVMATLAIFGRELVVAPHLSRWDVAAGLYAVSVEGVHRSDREHGRARGRVVEDPRHLAHPEGLERQLTAGDR